MNLRINLDLSKHCIKRELKRIYEKNISLCLKGKPEKDSEKIIEILKDIMIKNDLVHLRGKNRELSGKFKNSFELVIENNEKYILIDELKKIFLV